MRDSHFKSHYKFIKLKQIFITILIVLSTSCTQYNQTQIIDLPKLTRITNHEYRCVVLIQNPPENIDSLKALMVRYFIKEDQKIRSNNSQDSLVYIQYHRKTWDTSYFIDNPESSGGFECNEIRDYDELLGVVFKHVPYEGDDYSRTVDEIIIYKKDKEIGLKTVSTETLYDSAYPSINNWHKYE